MKVAFDGTETASTDPTATRQERVEATRIAVMDDQSLCSRAGFCGNRTTKIWNELENAGDSRVRFDIVQRVERCPSGRLTYDLGNGPIEPDLPRAIAATKDGPYWVTGSISITMSDGRSLETRNRVQLCRCGQSSNKPLCDGTHAKIKFKD
jgi:CDGSH-type Zn-finger protein